jgi:hypothetical protein
MLVLATVSSLVVLGCGRDPVERIFPRPPAIQFSDDVVAVPAPESLAAPSAEARYSFGTHTASRDERVTLALLLRPAPLPEAEAFLLAIEVPANRAAARALPAVTVGANEALAIDLPSFLGLPYEDLELEVYVWDASGLTAPVRVFTPLNRAREGALSVGITGATWFRDPIDDPTVTAAAPLQAAAGDRPGQVRGALHADQAAHEHPLLVLARSGTTFAWGRNPLPPAVRGSVPFDIDVRDLFRDGVPREGTARVILRHATAQTAVIEVPLAAR